MNMSLIPVFIVTAWTHFEYCHVEMLILLQQVSTRDHVYVHGDLSRWFKKKTLQKLQDEKAEQNNMQWQL